MKIEFDPQHLVPHFQLAATIAAARDIKPVLQNIKVKADKKAGVVLQATDTEVGIRVYCEHCDVVNNGDAIFPANAMKKAFAVTNVERFEIEGDDSKVTVRGDGDKVKYDLETMSPDEFPDVEEFEEKSYHVIPAKILKTMIRRTAFATDAENARYALGGVCFEMDDDTMNAVGTDGRRLAWQKGSADEAVGGHKVDTVIFPAKALQHLDKALEDDDYPVWVSVSEVRAIFKYKHITFFTRLVEGRFPKWKNIVPKKEDSTPVAIMAKVLLDGVRQAEIPTDPMEPGVIFQFGNGELTLLSSGRERGEAVIHISISYTGAEQKIKLDPKYMIEFLRTLDGESEVLIYLPQGDKPFMATADDDQYTYIVMPLSMN